MTIRILLADDHGIVREGLRMYLHYDPELEIVGEAANGREAVEMAHRLRPDLVLMDILMPVMDGIEATLAIRRDLPDTEVVVMTSVLDDSVIRRAVAAGAIGYLMKDTGSDELRSAIHAAADGQVQMSRAVAARLATGRDEKPDDLLLLEPLTERESEVLQEIVHGLTNKEIARKLSIAEKTVKGHVTNLLSKLGAASRTQAVLIAIRLQLATLEDAPE